MKKAVIVTGASSGIGASTSKYFSEKGYFVFLLGRNEERLSQVALECKNGSSLLKVDLNQHSTIEKYGNHLSTRKDVKIEVLVNNAGIYEPQSFIESSMESWRNQFETNLFGAALWTKMVLPLMIKSGKGSIINVASTLGLRPIVNSSAYSASKAAMISWTQTLALELASKNIRVNAICPGIVDTPIHRFHNFKGPEKEKIIESMGPLQPLGRIGTSLEIAMAIYFLASDDSSWTTGATLAVDGGINLL